MTKCRLSRADRGFHAGSALPLPSLVVGVAAAAAFFLLCSVNLESPGLYHDEVLQATGSFAYTGGEPVGPLAVGGIPLLNNSYLGALKTGIYGLYLRVSGNGFTVLSWRVLGILIVAVGILLFPVLARPLLTPLGAAVALALLITDATVILASRHDWGPTSIALLLRLLIIALLLRDGRTESGTICISALLGLFFGIAAFEKLSSIVLAAPLLAAFMLQPFRRKPSALGGLLAGACVGFLPLIVANGITYRSSGTLISLQDVVVQQKPSVREYVRTFPERFLALGAGSYLGAQNLGRQERAPAEKPEILLATALLAATVGISLWRFRAGAEFRAAVVMWLSFFAIPVSLYLLPRRTAIHHEIQVIPFLYAAAALTLVGMLRLRAGWRLKEKFAAGGLMAVFTLLLALRAFSAAGIIGDFRSGRTGPSWDRKLTELGYFAASKRHEAVFFAADWGVYNAIYCLAQGEPHMAHEVYWDYRGPDLLQRIARASKRPVAYVITPEGAGSVAPLVAARINQDVTSLRNWQEVPPEPEAAALQPRILVRKFLVTK